LPAEVTAIEFIGFLVQLFVAPGNIVGVDHFNGPAHVQKVPGGGEATASCFIGQGNLVITKMVSYVIH